MIEKLEELVNLGVTHVEMMPVAEFSGNCGWGYDGVDLFAPHHAYGGPRGLKLLVDACHARGLAVILDVVYNHVGPSGNYLGRYGPYFTDHFSTPWGPAVNLDGRGSDEVRRFFCDNALMWLRDYHFDGLRLDAVHAFVDSSTIPFLEQLCGEVREFAARSGRPCLIIAENDRNDPRPLWPVGRGGFQLDAQWNDDFHHSLHGILTGEKTGYYSDFGTLADFTKAFRQAYVYDGGYSAFRGRRQGRETTGLAGHQFVVYSQNHDQVGNRAQGERSSRLMNPGRLKIGAALVLLSPFIPLIFQGEEWGASTPFLYFTDHQEAGLAAAVRDGRRREFSHQGALAEPAPDPQARETFERSKLNWAERGASVHAELFNWYRELIRLRRAESALTDPTLAESRTSQDEARRWIVIHRGPVTIACNLADQPQRVPLPAGLRRLLLASAAGLRLTRLGVHLPSDSVAILKRAA